MDFIDRGLHGTHRAGRQGAALYAAAINRNSFSSACRAGDSRSERPVILLE